MTCIYNKNLALQICDRSGSFEDRTLNLIVNNNQDSLQIKIRDPSEFTFNYTETIDLGDYEILRAKQNLDINFNEFVGNLLEMLQQIPRREMFLRCEVSEKSCVLVFYNKSKIKSIIYVTLELHATSQKEILNEVTNNMHHIKDSNERLQLQVSNMKKIIANKDADIRILTNNIAKMDSKFQKVLKEVEDTIITKSRDFEYQLLKKIKILVQRLDELFDEVNTLKKKSIMKTESNSRLLRSIENLNIENIKFTNSIDQLEQKNNELQLAKMSLEKTVSNLRSILSERDAANRELQSKNEELRCDMEKATIIVAQKTSNIDELRRDLIQANQMLVNFNNHYDSKVKIIDNLQSTLVAKNQAIEEAKTKNYQLQREYDEYKAAYNSETQAKLKHELFMAQNKIEELEKSIRNTKKINALLSEKVNKIGM